jgi:hypothetical protein
MISQFKGIKKQKKSMNIGNKGLLKMTELMIAIQALKVGRDLSKQMRSLVMKLSQQSCSLR